MPVNNIFFYNFDKNTEVPTYSEVNLEEKTFIEELESLMHNNPN